MIRTPLGKKLPKKRPLSRWALSIGLSSSLLAIGAANAQDAAPADAPDRVIVTGSNIPTSEEVGEAPVDTVDQAARDATGQEDIENVLLKANPAISSGNNNVGSNNASISTNTTEGGSEVTIHGLPTLVLLDGRRLTDAAAVAAGGLQFSDVNLFPSALVKRIEVLKDGASAIYGSEAIGGVINVILDDQFTGFDFTTRYGFTEKSDIHDERYSGIVGFGDDKTHIVIGAEYREQDPIYNRQRDYSSPSFGTTTYAGIVRFPSAAGSASPFVLAPGLNSPNDVYAPGSVPLPANGVNPLPAAYSATTSTAVINGFDLSRATTITADQSGLNVYASGDRQLIGDKVVAFADFLYANNYAQSYLNAQPISTLTGVVIPAGAPYNPFNAQVDGNAYPVYVNNRFTGQPRTFRTDTNFYRIVAGLKGEIIKDVTYEVAFNSSQDEVNFKNPGLIVGSAINQATAGGYDADGTPDPAVIAGDGTITHVAGKYSSVNGNIQPALDFFAKTHSAASLQGITGTDLSDFTTKFGGVDGKVTAFPFNLPAGPVGVAGGGEYRHESLTAVTSPTSTFLDAAPAADINIGRDVFALFTEIRIPIISPDMKIPGAYSLDIDGAARYESYSDAGSDTVSKAGFTFRPIKDIALRGTYSASFIAPNLYELNGPSTQGFTNSVDLGAGSEQANSQSFTSKNLSDSRADNYTLGIVISPSAVPGLNMNLDFFHVDQRGIVGYLSGTAIVSSVNQLGTASPYSDMVRIGSFTGPQVTGAGQLVGNLANAFVTTSESNLGGQRIGGFDFGIHYTKDFGKYGQVSGGIDGTYYLQFQEQSFVGSKFYDVIGYYTGGADGTGEPAEIGQYHLTPSLQYKWGGVTLSALANYDPSVRDAASVSLDPTPGVGGVNGDKPGSIKAATGVDYLPVIRDYYTIDLLASYEFGLHKPAPEMAPSPKEGKDGKGGGKDMTSSATMAKEMVTTKLLDGLKVSIGCNNVTNARPPLISDSPDSTNTDAGIYDPYQRRYYITVEKKF